jgi:hypothetical protein
MATDAQIDANRLNSQKSTGPRSDEGKTNSRFNALKHGIDAASAIIPGEHLAKREALVHDYYARFRPTDPEERFLVDALIDAHWNRVRYTAIETQLMNRMLAELEPGDYPLARLFDPENPSSKLLERVVRHRETAERSWHRAYDELRKAIEARQIQEEHAGLTVTKPPGRGRDSGRPLPPARIRTSGFPAYGSYLG